MTDEREGYICPHCGNWNSIENKHCIVCNAEYDGYRLNNTGDSTWHIVPDNDNKKNNEHGQDSDTDPTPDPRWKTLMLAILAICLMLVATALLGRFVSGIKDSPSESNFESRGETIESENVQELIDSKEDEHEYTAPYLPLAYFGGETKGDELVVHAPVYDNHKNEYATGLGGTRGGVENITEYLIGDQYKYFSFRIVLNYERRTDYHEDSYVRVYADGSQIFKSEQVGNGYEPTDVILDIRGVERLKIGICGWGDIRLVDAVLHNDEGYEQYSTKKTFTNKQDFDRVPLSYLEYWNGSSAEGGLKYISGIIKDSYGQLYDGAFAGTHENQDNWVEYDITDCGFKKITGTIIMNPDPGGVDITSPVVKILEDPWREELYKSEPVKEGSPVQHFEVSLKNTEQLWIQIGGKYNVRLVDCYLSK